MFYRVVLLQQDRDIGLLKYCVALCRQCMGTQQSEGYIHSVDEKISRWFPELNKDTDESKRTITIRELMNQASGLWHETLGTMTGIGDFLALSDPSGYTLHAPFGVDNSWSLFPPCGQWWPLTNPFPISARSRNPTFSLPGSFRRC
jgi:hypothetical protein